MTQRVPTIALVATAALLTTSLSGCGGGERIVGGSDAAASPSTGADEDPEESPDVEAPEASSPAPVDPPDEEIAGDVTPPGARLGVGETATVNGTFDKDVRIAYTFTGVSDVSTPLGQVYSARFEVMALDDLQGEALSLWLTTFTGLDANGDSTVLGVDESCDDSLELSSLRAGDTADLCVAVNAVGDAPLTEIQYVDGVYDADPIAWEF